MPNFKTLSDLADLAKAGFKPNDIKDLLELAKTVPETDPKGGDALNSDNSDKDKKQADDKDKTPEEDPIEAIIKRESEG